MFEFSLTFWRFRQLSEHYQRKYINIFIFTYVFLKRLDQIFCNILSFLQLSDHSQQKDIQIFSFTYVFLKGLSQLFLSVLAFSSIFEHSQRKYFQIFIFTYVFLKGRCHLSCFLLNMFEVTNQNISKSSFLHMFSLRDFVSFSTFCQLSEIVNQKYRHIIHLWSDITRVQSTSCSSNVELASIMY